MKRSIIEAFDWQKEHLIPEWRDNRKKFIATSAVIKLRATGISSIFANGLESLEQNITSIGYSQTDSFAEQSVLRPVKAASNSQTFTQATFYFVIAGVALTAKAFCSTFFSGPATDVTSIKQLTAKTFAQSFAGRPVIYYVNYGGKAVSQTFPRLITKAKVLNFQSRSISQSYADCNEKLYKLIATHCISIDQTYSIANISRLVPTNARSLDQTESIGNISSQKKLSVDGISQTKISSQEVVQRKLSVEGVSLTNANTQEYILFNIKGRSISSTLSKGGEVLTRILQSQARSQSLSTPNISKSIKTTGEMQSNSYSDVTEKITRVLNGVAESQSFPRPNVSVSRLFVSNIISQSFSKNTEIITKNIKAACFSQIYIDSATAIIKPIAAKANTGNPFHVNISKQINIVSAAINITNSKVQEVVQKNLVAKGNSQNPFHVNPNLAKQLKAAAITDSFISGQTKKLINLEAASISDSYADVNEKVQRPLIACTIDTSPSYANGFNTKINIYGTGLAISESHVVESKKINYQLQMITQTFIGVTSNYLGSHYEEVQYVDRTELGVENLAPFNIGDEKDSTLNPD